MLFFYFFILATRYATELNRMENSSKFEDAEEGGYMWVNKTLTRCTEYEINTFKIYNKILYFGTVERKSAVMNSSSVHTGNIETANVKT